MESITKLDNIEPGNPFLSDLSHMGATLGKNVVVMYSKSESEEQPYLIICDTKTGERLRVDLTKEAQVTAEKSQFVDHCLHEKEGLPPTITLVQKSTEVMVKELATRLLTMCRINNKLHSIVQAYMKMVRLYRANIEGRFLS